MRKIHKYGELHVLWYDQLSISLTINHSLWNARSVQLSVLSTENEFIKFLKEGIT